MSGWRKHFRQQMGWVQQLLLDLWLQYKVKKDHEMQKVLRCVLFILKNVGEHAIGIMACSLYLYSHIVSTSS
jgi:hypothetical protein